MARPQITLAQVAQKVQPMTLARDQTLAVPGSLTGLLPDGLPRGSVVAVEAARGVMGATSLALALAAGPSQSGGWVAVLGLRSLGLLAASGLGVVSERLALVAAPERRSALASVVAALVDGFDVVVVGSEARRRLNGGNTRRLMARLRERGGVLLAVGDDLPGGSAQVRMRVVASRWEGLERGAGHLQRRRVTVEVGGRGAASRLRRLEVLLPDEDGRPVVPPTDVDRGKTSRRRRVEVPLSIPDGGLRGLASRRRSAVATGGGVGVGSGSRRGEVPAGSDGELPARPSRRRRSGVAAEWSLGSGPRSRSDAPEVLGGEAGPDADCHDQEGGRRSRRGAVVGAGAAW